MKKITITLNGEKKCLDFGMTISDLISKFDGEYPETSMPIIADFLEIEKTRLTEVVNLHRRKDIWNLENSEWKLRFPLTLTDV